MGSREQGDKPVVVVGAGAGGLPVAVAVAESGRQVVLLEAGGSWKASDYPSESHNYENIGFVWKKDSDNWRGPFDVHRSSGLGGSTQFFQAVSEWPSLNLIKSWGVDSKKFSSAKKQVEETVPIAGISQPAHPLNSISYKLFLAAAELGWSPELAKVAILSQAHKGRPPCNYCGLCLWMYPWR